MKNLLVVSSFLTLFGLGLLAGKHKVFADDNDRNWEQVDSHELARSALQKGEVLPIQELLIRVREQIPGEIVGIEFEKEYGRWVYELKIIDESGRLLEVYVDAETGDVLAMEED